MRFRNCSFRQRQVHIARHEKQARGVVHITDFIYNVRAPIDSVIPEDRLLEPCRNRAVLVPQRVQSFDAHQHEAEAHLTIRINQQHGLAVICRERLRDRHGQCRFADPTFGIHDGNGDHVFRPWLVPALDSRVG